MKYCTIFILLFLLYISSCEKNTDKNVFETEAKMDQFSNQDIQKLLNKKIFFGHMSVGYNIIDGLNDIIREDPRFFGFSIFEITDGVNILDSGFYHQRNGKNGYPASKCDAFKNYLLNNNIGTEFDIAFFKFCYVDIKEDSDVKEIFENYVITINEVEEKFPNLKIIHITIPLTAHSFTFKQKIKNIYRTDFTNIKRNQYNQLLRKKYIKTHQIFDLAKAESTYPDGSRQYFTSDGDKYYSLIKKYTYDGGHLNEYGRKQVASELLKTMLASQ